MRKDGIYYTQNYEDKNFHYNQDCSSAYPHPPPPPKIC